MKKNGFVHKNASLNYKLTVFLAENVKKPSIRLQVDVQANEKLLTKPNFEKENYRKNILRHV